MKFLKEKDLPFQVGDFVFEIGGYIAMEVIESQWNGVRVRFKMGTEYKECWRSITSVTK